MQVLWVSHAVPYPPKAGFLLRAYHLLKGVAARHEVDLVAFVQEAWLRTIYGDVEQGLEEARRELSGFCRSVHFLPIRSLQGPYARHRTALRALLSGRSYTSTWLDQPDAIALIAELARRHRHELAHFDTIGLAPLARAIPGQLATLGHHNIESHLFTRRSQTERGRFQKWYFAREGRLLQEAERASVSRFGMHFTCSELDSERLREIEPGVRIECVPNGVDCDYFAPSGSTSPAERERPNSFTFIGTMNWHPNSDAMIFFLRDVWPQLRQEIPDATLDIVGANAPAALTELAARSPGVTLHGFVPDVRPYLARASVFVCPIMDGGGTKLKVLDAFSSGKAVLAHPIALEGIDATPGVDVEVASTPAEFIASARRLFADPAHRARLGVRARELAQRKYSFAAIASHLAAVMEQVAGERRR
jgi:glycosyltransferase involved in cell wall biosynthesis